MLALGRKKGEKIQIKIPDGRGYRIVWVVLLDIQAKRVRLGIDADPDVVIVREELLQRERDND